MANMSDWLERNLSTAIFGSGSLGPFGTIAIALTSTVPTDAMTGATIPEIANANSYSRQTLNRSGANWKDLVATGATDGATSNSVAVTFGPATSSDWGWVSGVAILDSATHGAGNVLFHGSLTTPKLIQVNDSLVLGSGNLSVTFA